MADRDHRGLVKNDPFASDVNQGVGGAEVNGEVGRKLPTKSFKHGAKILWGMAAASCGHRLVLNGEVGC
ncbi:hypothetical protein D9M70_628960 [compost metagenome]